MTPNPSVMLKTAMGKQLYGSRVARSAVLPERSLRSSGPPWAKARDDFGRQIDVMTYGLVACRETEKETKDAFQEVLYDGDGGAAGNVIKIALSGASQSFDHAREMSERFIAGWGGYPLVGTPEQVVEGMKQLGEAGMGGMIMGLIDPDKERAQMWPLGGTSGRIERPDHPQSGRRPNGVRSGAGARGSGQDG